MEKSIGYSTTIVGDALDVNVGWKIVVSHSWTTWTLALIETRLCKTIIQIFNMDVMTASRVQTK